jgi:pyruvate/2-oxoglutarate dehydrogenase complex dihydrolipoamide dehydrogenase (E3) component
MPSSKSMTDPREVDVVVLGLGTSGEDLALQLLDAGLEVAGIEAQLLGGECPYWACIPSKAMIRSGNLLQEARRVNGVAGTAEVSPDWSLLASRVRDEITGNWDDSYAVERFEGKGGVFARGWGRLTGPNSIAVGNRVFTARRGIVIATGSAPFVPPIPGLADVHYWTTHEAIAADPLPESLIVLGGGAVGCELGQVFARFGTRVSILEGSHRLLSREEPEASEVIRSAFEEEGISVVTGEHAESVSEGREGIEVRTDAGRSIVAARLLVATGRKTDLSRLGLETAGLDGSGRFIEVDEQMRATEGIWAMGDISGRAMFTHVGIYQSTIIANEIIGRSQVIPDFEAMPRVTFTDPEVGAVGITEGMAEERGIEVAIALKQVPSTFRGWLHTVGNKGIIKLIIDEQERVLLGATVVGPNAGEVLGMLSLAVHERTPLDRLRSMIYAFPTFHGGIGEALGAYGRGTGKVVDPNYEASAYLG